MARYELVRCETAEQRLTIESLASTVNIDPRMLDKLVMYGVVEPVQIDNGVEWFDVAEIARLRMVCRLRGDLGINLPGIAVVLDLLERIEVLQRELINLREPSVPSGGGWREVPREEKR
jgi:DNA-binding transcriptional MerR regulator